MPGFAFPSVGPLSPVLGRTCPGPTGTGYRTSASVPHFPGQVSIAQPSVLCSATTAKSPSRVPSLVAHPPIPCLLPFGLCPVSGSLVGGSCLTNARALVSTAVPLILCRFSKETIGSPKPVLSVVEGFPSCPLRFMPRSQTPVVS